MVVIEYDSSALASLQPGASWEDAYCRFIMSEGGRWLVWLHKISQTKTAKTSHCAKHPHTPSHPQSSLIISNEVYVTWWMFMLNFLTVYQLLNHFWKDILMELLWCILVVFDLPFIIAGLLLLFPIHHHVVASCIMCYVLWFMSPPCTTEYAFLNSIHAFILNIHSYFVWSHGGEPVHTYIGAEAHNCSKQCYTFYRLLSITSVTVTSLPFFSVVDLFVVEQCFI